MQNIESPLTEEAIAPVEAVAVETKDNSIYDFFDS